MQPGVMMLDEATNSLDQDSITILEREGERLLMRGCQSSGLPIVVRIERLADRVIVMEDGKIISDTSAAHYFKN